MALSDNCKAFYRQKTKHRIQAVVGQRSGEQEHKLGIDYRHMIGADWELFLVFDCL